MKLQTFAVLGLGLSLSACESAPADDDMDALGAYVYVNNCQPCHAADGSGNASNGAPGISGMPDWYVQEQVQKFRDGRRGKHFDDIAGLRMRPMARTLTNDQELEAVSSYVAAMPRQRLEGHAVQGDVEAGKKHFLACAACHGADGSGNKQLSAPPLTGADDWYLLTQLHNFKTGIRGTADGDVTGAQMRPNVLALDEKALTDVVAYINTL